MPASPGAPATTGAPVPPAMPPAAPAGGGSGPGGGGPGGAGGGGGGGGGGKPPIDPQQLARLNEHYLAASRGISERVRYIAFGIVAVVYALYSSNSDFAADLLETSGAWLNAAAISAVVAIALDFLRQVCTYISSADAYEKEDLDWDTKSAAYKVADFLFWLKQIAVFVAVVCLIIAMLRGLDERDGQSRCPSEPECDEQSETQRIQQTLDTHVATEATENSAIRESLSRLKQRRPPAPQTCRRRVRVWTSDGRSELRCEN